MFPGNISLLGWPLTGRESTQNLAHKPRKIEHLQKSSRSSDSGFNQTKFLYCLTKYVGKYIDIKKILMFKIIIKYIFILHEICIQDVDIYCYIFNQTL
jgi:hypothetical protein